MSYGETPPTYNQDQASPNETAAADLATDAQAQAELLLGVVDFLRRHFPNFEGLPHDPRAPAVNPEKEA